MPSGHVEPNLVLPIGVEVEIDTAADPTLRVPESPLLPARARAEVHEAAANGNGVTAKPSATELLVHPADA
jgi:hypothetical protein